MAIFDFFKFGVVGAVLIALSRTSVVRSDSIFIDRNMFLFLALIGDWVQLDRN